MRILVINPTLKNEILEQGTLKELDMEFRNSSSLSFSVEGLDWGPSSVESEYDERFASPFVLEKVIDAQTKGYDAIVISCTDDVALNASREVSKIPVIAPLEICMHVASTLGDKFSILAVMENETSVFFRRAREYGTINKLASVRSINIPALDLEAKREEVTNSLLEEGRRAIKEDGADTLILGCTGMIRMAASLQEKLRVPVLDPLSLSIRYALLLASSGLSHSRLAYPPPPAKLRNTLH